MHDHLTAPIGWKTHLFTILKAFFCFAVITFFLAYFIFHHPERWLLPSLLCGSVYVLLIVLGLRYLIKQLPIPVFMLLVPIAPLVILLYVVSLIAFLQRFT